MGIAVWIAVGCNVSGFYTAAAPLRPEAGSTPQVCTSGPSWAWDLCIDLP